MFSKMQGTFPFITYSKADDRNAAMTRLFYALLAAIALSTTMPVAARNGQRAEQDAALNATRNGGARSLRQIENSVVPNMEARGANYIGQEFNSEVNQYRLKFMRGRSVIWVDVDARTGAVVSRAGGD